MKQFWKDVKNLEIAHERAMKFPAYESLVQLNYAVASLSILVAMCVIQLILWLFSLGFNFISVVAFLIWISMLNIASSIRIYRKFTISKGYVDGETS